MCHGHKKTCAGASGIPEKRPAKKRRIINRKPKAPPPVAPSAPPSAPSAPPAPFLGPLPDTVSGQVWATSGQLTDRQLLVRALSEIQQLRCDIAAERKARENEEARRREAYQDYFSSLVRKLERQVEEDAEWKAALEADAASDESSEEESEEGEGGEAEGAKAQGAEANEGEEEMVVDEQAGGGSA